MPRQTANTKIATRDARRLYAPFAATCLTKFKLYQLAELTGVALPTLSMWFRRGAPRSPIADKRIAMIADVIGWTGKRFEEPAR